MSGINIFVSICMLAGMIVPCIHALHMFQQNRYELGRLNTWLKENIRGNIKKNSLLLCVVILSVLLSVFLRNTAGKIVLCICLLLMTVYQIVREKKTVYIKPLVYTSRVKRQIAVMAVLAVILSILITASGAYPCAVPAAFFGPWLLLYPMAVITSPVEAAVRKSFLNDAKNILNNHADLIKIGITGSYGKTTTKNIMQAVLSEQFNSLMTPASYNTPMGITRTIREYLKPIHQVFVCEMGADHVGDITELMEFVHPSVGVVTSIGPQHLNTFGTQENIIAEKMQVIEKLPENGLGILNYDNEYIRNYKIHNSVDTVTYAIHNEEADYRAVNIEFTQHGSSFTIVHGDESVPFETKLLGELNILNILSAAACARYLGVEWKVIQRAVKQMKQVEHRLELKKINGYRFIDDAFNANPSGSAMALEVLSMMPGHRYIVTPGMIDLGEKQNAVNKHFGSLMKDKADTVVLVGENQTRPIYEGLQESGFDMNQVVVLKTEKEAFQFIWQSASVNDTILLENDLPDAFNH